MTQPRRNPFEGVTDYVSELGRMRSLGVHGVDHGSEAAERTHASAWVPVTDILARGADLVIRIELPGVDPSEVNLLFNRGVLTVSGTRAGETEEERDDVSFYVRERFHGAFRRVITLPEGTEADQLSAEFDDGLVEVTVRDAVERHASTRIAVGTPGHGRRSVGVRDGGDGAAGR